MKELKSQIAELKEAEPPVDYSVDTIRVDPQLKKDRPRKSKVCRSGCKLLKGGCSIRTAIILLGTLQKGKTIISAGAIVGC